MTLRLNGSTSGYSEIDAPAIAGDQTFTLPGTGGTVATQTYVESYVENLAIGVNQTWQDVTASRSANVTYTNNTGRPILVAISINTQATPSYFINGVEFFRANANATGAGSCTTFLVPAGATYQTSVGFLYWSELC